MLYTSSKVFSTGLEKQLKIALHNGDELAGEILEEVTKPYFPAECHYGLRARKREGYFYGYDIEKRYSFVKETHSVADFAIDVLQYKYGSPQKARERYNSSSRKLARSFTTKFKLCATIEPVSLEMFLPGWYAGIPDMSYTTAGDLYHRFLYSYSSGMPYAHFCWRFFTTVAPCKAVVVRDMKGKIHGRALIWSNVQAVNPNGVTTVSMMDTPLAASEAAEDVMIDKARQRGIQLRMPMRYASWDRPYTHGIEYLQEKSKSGEAPDSLMLRGAASPGRLYVPLNMDAKYLGGFPKYETAGYVVRRDNKLYLGFTEHGVSEDLLVTDTPGRYICPVCGKTHTYSMSDSHTLTRDKIPKGFGPLMGCCIQKHDTVFGTFFDCEAKSCGDYGMVPAACVDEAGNLTPTAKMAFLLSKLSVAYEAVPGGYVNEY